MKKSNSRFVLIIICVVAAALSVSAVITYKIIELKNQPAVIEVTYPVTGEGTGYYRHCYEELNDAEKELYAAVLQSIYAMPEKIPVRPFADGSFDKVFSALSLDNPDLFSMGLTSILGGDSKGTYFQPEYSMTAEEYAERLAQVRSKAAEIVNAAAQFTSAYERELYVHNYIINNCVYSTGGPNVNNIYGCLIEGVASCEGYSRAFQYLLSLLDIDNRLVTGTGTASDGTSEGHMWNYVVLDGEGYFVDVTWDDPVSESGNTVIHKYFNINTDKVLVNHSDIVQTLPLCTNTKYGYFTYENCILSDDDEETLRQSVENSVINSLQRGGKNVEFSFVDKNTLDSCMEKMFKTSILYDAYSAAGISVQEDNFNVYYSKDEAMLYVCLYF